MAIVDELIAILGYDVRGERELDRFNQGLVRAERRAQAVANRINAMSVAVGSFFGMVAAQGAMRLGSAIGSLPGDILSVGREFENLETVLTTIEGSSEKAKSSLDWVQEFASTTPYDLKQVGEAFVRMRAYGMDPMSGELRKIGDAAAGMGKSIMDGVEAIADAVTGENERLKSFGIRTEVAGDQITYKWKEDGKELTKTVKKNGEEITAALMEIFGRFEGAMDELSKTQGGVIANLGDEWTNFLKLIGEKGYYDDVTRRLNGLKTNIERWGKDGTIDAVATGISNFLSGTMDIAGHIGSQLWAVGRGAFYAASGMTDLISRVTGLNSAASAGVLGAAVLGSSAMGRGMMLALARKVPMIAALLAIDDLITASRGGDSVILPYIQSLEGGQEALEKSQRAWADLGAAFSDLRASIEGLSGVELPEWLSSPDQWVNEFAVSFVNNLADALKSLAGAVNAMADARWSDVLPNLNKFMAKGLVGEGLAKSIVDWWQGDGEETAPVNADRATAVPPKSTGKSGRLSTEPNPARFEQGIPAVSGWDELRTAMEYFKQNSARVEGGSAGEAVLNDNRVSNDNRQFPMNTTVNVGGVNVNGAAQAPGAVGRAVGNAAAGAVTQQRSRIASTPTTSGNGPQ